MIELQSRVLKFVVKIFPFSGSLMLLASIVMTIENCQFIITGSRIQGSIVSVSESKHKIIEILPVGQTKVISADGGDGSSSNYKIGNHVTVLCIRNNNYKSSLTCKVDTPISLWGTAVFMSICGVMHWKIAIDLRRSNELK